MTLDELKANANAKWTGFKVRAKRKVREVYQWTLDNREETAVIISVGTVLIGGAFKTAKSINRRVCLDKEQRFKELHVYDRSLGIYHELKHKLRPAEIQQIDIRRSQGESLAHILKDMKLIK